MKKHRIKNYLKLGFLLFGVSLLVVNCQKDDSEAIDEPVVKKSPFHVNQVSIEEIPTVGNVLQKPGTASSNRTVDLSCGTINLDDILQVTHLEEGKTNYSFHFLHESDQDGSVFYNYLITENDDDTYGEFILEYIPDETFLSQYSIYSPEGIENFSGQLNLYSYADFCGSPSQRTASSTPLPPCASTGVGSGGSAGGPDNSGDVESGGNGSGGGGGSICNAILSTHLSCGYANPPHYSSCYTTVISGWECHAVSIANTDGINNSSATSRTVGGLDCEDVDFAGIAPYEALRNINECLGGSLSDDDIEWLSDAENADSTNAISTYIDTNGCSDENQNFVEKAMEAFMNDGEVDFVNEVILDESFVNNEKLKCVYDKLTSDNSPLFKNTIGAFIDDPEFNLTFKVGNCSNTDDACTDAENPNDIIITIEDVNLTGLGMATLILHEAIHAEIHRFVAQFASGVDINDRPRLFQLYAFYKGWAENYEDEDYNWTQDAHHQYMVENYVNEIASVIRGLDNNNYPLSHYMAYGWDGLTSYGYTSSRLTDAENTENQNLRAIADTNSQVCN